MVTERTPIDASPLSNALVVAAGTAIVLLGLTVGTRVLADGDGTALRRAARASVLGWLAWIIPAMLVAPDLGPALLVLATALSGLASVVVTGIAHRGGVGRDTVTVYALLVSATVFTPVAIATLSETSGLLTASFGIVDIAGTLATVVATGCAGLVAIVLGRGTGSRPATPVPTAVPTGVPTGVLVGAWVLVIAWYAGMELQVNAATPVMLASAVLAPTASAFVWVLVQRMNRSRAPGGAALGVLCGLAAAGPGSGVLTPVTAAVAGGIAALVCASVGYPLLRRGRRPIWLPIIALVGGGGVGTVLVGVLAERSGILYTGQPEQLAGQFLSTLLVAGYALAASTASWWFARRLTPSRPRAASGGAGS